MSECYFSLSESLHILINPYQDEYLKWNNSPFIFGTIHYHFKGCPDESLKLVGSIEPGQTAHIYCLTNDKIQHLISYCIMTMVLT